MYEMEGCNIKYEDINKVFNLIDVTDTYILLKDKEKIKSSINMCSTLCHIKDAS